MTQTNVCQFKDKIFDVYQKTGSYANIPGVKELEHARNRYDLYNFIGWFIIVMVPTVYYLINALYSGSWTFKIILVVAMLSSKICLLNKKIKEIDVLIIELI